MYALMAVSLVKAWPMIGGPTDLATTCSINSRVANAPDDGVGRGKANIDGSCQMILAFL